MVTFVGIHYKEGMKALDSRTRSGKKIDAVIERLNCECKKTNLFSGLEVPKCKEEQKKEVIRFREQINDEGVFILLGGKVKRYFPYQRFENAKIINHRHPSFSPSSFVDELTEKILSAVKK